MKYTVYYEFQGTGYVDVEADSESEASDKFHSGEWSGDDHEQGENYEVKNIERKTI